MYVCRSQTNLACEAAECKRTAVVTVATKNYLTQVVHANHFCSVHAGTYAAEMMKIISEWILEVSEKL